MSEPEYKTVNGKRFLIMDDEMPLAKSLLELEKHRDIIDKLVLSSKEEGEKYYSDLPHDDVEVIVQAFDKLNYTLTTGHAYQLWYDISESVKTNWLAAPSISVVFMHLGFFIAGHKNIT